MLCQDNGFSAVDRDPMGRSSALLGLLSAFELSLSLYTN